MARNVGFQRWVAHSSRAASCSQVNSPLSISSGSWVVRRAACGVRREERAATGWVQEESVVARSASANVVVAC